MSSAKVGSDEKSRRAKESKEYWLCECGYARNAIDEMSRHCDTEGHMAERINTDRELVTGFYAGGMTSEKYGNSVPASAQVSREKYSTDPIFERP